MLAIWLVRLIVPVRLLDGLGEQALIGNIEEMHCWHVHWSSGRFVICDASFLRGFGILGVCTDCTKSKSVSARFLIL